MKVVKSQCLISNPAQSQAPSSLIIIILKIVVVLAKVFTAGVINIRNYLWPWCVVFSTGEMTLIPRTRRWATSSATALTCCPKALYSEKSSLSYQRHLFGRRKRSEQLESCQSRPCEPPWINIFNIDYFHFDLLQRMEISVINNFNIIVSRATGWQTGSGVV